MEKQNPEKDDKIFDAHSKIYFNNLLDFKWSRFFTLIGWRWTYHKDKDFAFKLSVHGIPLNVKTIDTDCYEFLKNEFYNILEKRYNGTFLLLGKVLFDIDEINKQINQNSEYEFNPFSRCIGLFGFRMNDKVHNSLAFFYKVKTKFYLRWIHHEFNWILENYNSKKRYFELGTNSESYQHLDKDIHEEIDNIWHQMNNF